MKKRFNTTGNCFEHQHYMMDDSRRFNAIFEMVEYGDYFVINRPRQYGKTTMLFALLNNLKKRTDYLPVFMSFQGTGLKPHQSDEGMINLFWDLLLKGVKKIDAATAQAVQAMPRPTEFEKLSELISDMIELADKKLVLLIDEVDDSTEYDAFLRLLGMFRSKYLARGNDELTFHSIVLAGVHDIKSLKFKLRSPDDARTNSPWNVAVDFKVVMEFYPNEIAYMLRQYSEAEGVTMDFDAISERLYYHTSGYPFLISKLCKNIAEDILPTKKDKTVWTLDDVEESARLILKESNTNFDSLIKNLENNRDLYNLVYAILIDGAVVPFNADVSLIKLGIIYGMFKENGRVKIHNRIYEQRIYNYMAARKMEENITKEKQFIGDQFSDNHGGLDLEAVLRKFQAFMKENYSTKNDHYIEREWRLLFLSFLKPIINGKGHDFKEVQVSQEKRLDIVVTYLEHKYIIELKIWDGLKAHDKGLNQLADYLDIHGVEKGYLLIFDDRKNLTWAVKTIEHKGKEIFAVWV